MPDTLPSVDENGNPETPLGQATAKKKQKNLTILALALGGVGVAVTVFLKKRSAASTTATGSTGYTYPSLDPNAATSSQFPALNDTLTTLQNQIAALSSASSPVTTQAPSPNPYADNKIIGGGYLTQADPNYAFLPSWTAFASAFSTNQPVYYEPAAGVYEQVTPFLEKQMETNPAFQGTPTYLARPSAWSVASASGTGPVTAHP